MSKKLIYSFFIVTIFIFTGCVKKENQLNLSDISAKKENTIGTTIHDAVRINDLELVKTFINKGVDLNKKIDLVIPLYILQLDLIILILQNY